MEKDKKAMKEDLTNEMAGSEAETADTKNATRCRIANVDTENTMMSRCVVVQNR